MTVAAFDPLSQQWIFEVGQAFVRITSTVIWALVMHGPQFLPPQLKANT